MSGSRTGLVLSVITLFAVSLGAQRTSSANRPLTNAQLQAKVRALEDENAALMRDYDLLLASCRNPAPRDAQPAGSADDVARDTAGSKETPGSVRRPRNVDDDLFWIVSVNYGVTETTPYGMRFGWKVIVHNGLPRNEIFDLTVQFLNKDDLTIDSGHIGVQTIRSLDEQTVTGDTVIKLPAALNVVSAKAVINRHR